jgi:hypothetical protein
MLSESRRVFMPDITELLALLGKESTDPTSSSEPSKTWTCPECQEDKHARCSEYKREPGERKGLIKIIDCGCECNWKGSFDVEV